MEKLQVVFFQGVVNWAGFGFEFFKTHSVGFFHYGAHSGFVFPELQPLFAQIPENIEFAIALQNVQERKERLFVPDMLENF